MSEAGISLMNIASLSARDKATACQETLVRVPKNNFSMVRQELVETMHHAKHRAAYHMSYQSTDFG